MPRVSPEDLMQLVYDEVNRAIRTTALLVFQGQIELGTVEIKDALSSRRLTVREDGPDSAAVVTANALPLPQGAATEAGQDALLGKDFSTEATLGAVLAKLASVGLDAATLAALESISVQNFPGDYPDTAAATKLDQLLGKDFSREVTLAAVLAKLSAVGLDAATLAALESISVQNFPGDYPDAAAAAKLDQLLGKDFAREVTLAAVLAKLSAVGLDAATLAALESISVQNFPSDYPAAGTQSRLDTLNAKAFATEPTLAAVLAKLIGDPATAPRQDSMIGLLGGGAREHRETTVSTTYDPLTNKVALSAARKHLSIFPKEDVYWVDSAASDADAGTKLSSPNQRGFIRAGQRFSLALKTGVTRLDFLGRAQSGLLYVTAMD